MTENSLPNSRHDCAIATSSPLTLQWVNTRAGLGSATAARRADNLPAELARLLGDRLAGGGAARQSAQPFIEESFETAKIEGRPGIAELTGHRPDARAQCAAVFAPMALRQQRAGVKKYQHLTESAGFHRAHRLERLVDFADRDVFEPFGHLQFVEDFESIAVPHHRLEQRALLGAHVILLALESRLRETATRRAPLQWSFFRPRKSAVRENRICRKDTHPKPPAPRRLFYRAPAPR